MKKTIVALGILVALAFYSVNFASADITVSSNNTNTVSGTNISTNTNENVNNNTNVNNNVVSTGCDGGCSICSDCGKTSHVSIGTSSTPNGNSNSNSGSTGGSGSSSASSSNSSSSSNSNSSSSVNSSTSIKVNVDADEYKVSYSKKDKDGHRHKYNKYGREIKSLPATGSSAYILIAIAVLALAGAIFLVKKYVVKKVSSNK